MAMQTTEVADMIYMVLSSEDRTSERLNNLDCQESHDTSNSATQQQLWEL
jgi:hypothetical protein